MTEITKRFLEIPELPDDFDISDTKELTKVLKAEYLQCFVHKDILYRLEERSGESSIDNSKYYGKPATKTDLVKTGPLMPKDFRVELISSEGEAAAKAELSKANDRIERLSNAMSDLKDRSFNEKFVLKAIAAANGHDL